MILNEQQIDELAEVAGPLINWLNDNCHPHVVAIVTPDRIELNEGVCSVPVTDYIHD